MVVHYIGVCQLVFGDKWVIRYLVLLQFAAPKAADAPEMLPQHSPELHAALIQWFLKS